MKIILILIAVGLIGFIGFSLLGNEANAPTVEENQEENIAVENGQTVPGASEGVSDMEVEEMNESEVSDEGSTEATQSEGSTEVKVFNVDSFSFGYSETEIRVNRGDTVTINLTNSEGFHDWVVDEFNAATEKIRVGETTSVTFVADQAGTFEFYCSVGSHREQGMVGTLIVE